MKNKLTPRAKELLHQMRDENVLDGIVPNLRSLTRYAKKHGKLDAHELAILKEDIDDLSDNLAELVSVLRTPADAEKELQAAFEKGKKNFNRMLKIAAGVMGEQR